MAHANTSQGSESTRDDINDSSFSFFKEQEPVMLEISAANLYILAASANIGKSIL